MEHYFVVLELPGGEELKFKEGKDSPTDFWKTAADAIELRKYLKHIKKFTTFVLVHMHFHASEFVNEKLFYKKLSKWLKASSHGIVIDTADNFQLVTVEM
jgi:hypothetical protein